MIKLILISLIFSFSLFARVDLVLDLPVPSVKQGEIVKGTLTFVSTDGNMQMSGLKGKNFGKSLYLMSVSPFMKKQGLEGFVSDVKIIFSQVPQTNTLTEVVNGDDVTISWNGLEVIPTEPEKSFLLGSFEIPKTKPWMLWLLTGCGSLFFGLLAFMGVRKFNKGKGLKAQRHKIKDEILSAISYNDVVMVWKKKHIYLSHFPKLEDPFKQLETTLFKYQFKPSQNNFEMQEVVRAYGEFVQKAREILNGI